MLLVRLCRLPCGRPALGSQLLCGVFAMTTLFGVCAAIGGTVLVCQFIMTVLGLGGELTGLETPDHVHLGHGGHGPAHPEADGHAAADGDTHHDSSWFFGIITFRTVVAAMTFFGLVGLAGQSGDWPPAQTLVAALLAGGLAMYGVHWMMKGLHRLRADGTVRIERAVGASGSVYLRVPGGRSGVGKVQVNVQNRTMEYEAVTSQDELPTGTPVVVVKVIGPDRVEVAAVPASGSASHV